MTEKKRGMLYFCGLQTPLLEIRVKGISILVDEGIIFKKRGVGMFVAPGAVSKLRDKRKELFFDHYIKKLIEEAKKLGITNEEILGMVERGYQE